MIRIEGRGAAYGEVWQGEEPPDDPGVDILTHRHRGAPLPGARNRTVLTAVTDLAEGPDAIAGKISKPCRQEIRRADTKDGLSAEFFTEPESRVEAFRAFYNAFAAQKALAPAYQAWLVAAARAGQLLLTSASREGETLVWHACVIAGDGAQLEYSASCFRSRESDYRALVGRANRWLHWRDLLWLGERGITRFDWGGLFEDESTPERAGINRFKNAFGGRHERLYDCTAAVTLRGRIWLSLREAWSRRNAAPPGAPRPGTAPHAADSAVR